MSQQLSSRYLCGLFFLHVIFAVATLGVFCFALAAAIHSGIWFLIFFPGVFGLALAIIFGLGLPNDWTRWQNARQLKAHGGGTVAILATHLHEFNRLTGSTNYLLYEDFVCWLWRVQDLLNEGDLLAALDELEAGGQIAREQSLVDGLQRIHLLPGFKETKVFALAPSRRD